MIEKRLTRRSFLEIAASVGLYLAKDDWKLNAYALPRGTSEALPSAPFPVDFKKRPPYESLVPYIEPGRDGFPIEKDAAEITDHLTRLAEARTLPVSDDFSGHSPVPVQYHRVADGVFRAEFGRSALVGGAADYQKTLSQWLDLFGQIRSARFFVLPNNCVRYEISSEDSTGFHYRVGQWEQTWKSGRLSRAASLDENRTTSTKLLFQDVTSSLFGAVDSFGQQMLRGVPYWRARLDSASGIDIYGENGIAVGDIDGDGWDEIYVCQPGGLPNRLYKNLREKGMVDITDQAGVGVLDDTNCALFVDFRNRGVQDLVVLTNYGPLLFLNRGNGTFSFKPRAFRFASKPQGAFSGMAAADYDLDGRVDLYLCCYVYYQSEDQYRYPIPFHDAKNGPPNFMFRNELTADGDGIFTDVTEAVGLNQNNDRYSFAPAWCDYNGDGWPDLYVANDFGRKNLYKNDHGHFSDVAAEAGVEDSGPGMSASWFDYDGDGRPDLYVSNMWTAAGQRVIESPTFTPAANAALREVYRRHTKGNSLYRNRGDGTFEETETLEGVEMGRWAWCSDGVDFDNDGSPEIFITTGMFTNSSEQDLESFFWRQVAAKSPQQKGPAPEYEQGWDALNELVREGFDQNGRERNVLYARRGSRFYDLSGISGLDYADDSRAFAAIDFDGDGNIDLLLKSRLGPQIRALRNDWGVGGHVLAVQLRGTRSNRDAIGAAVEVNSGEFRNWQFVRAGSGYISQHTKTLHFGLRDKTLAEVLRIKWPSGLIQEIHNLPAGFTYFIVEGSSDVARQPFLPRQSVPPSPAVIGDNQPRSEATWLLEPVPLPERRNGPGFLCLINGQKPAAPSNVQFELLDLGSESADLAASYALFRKYLLDYRSDLVLPFVILLDERGFARKIYPSIPSAAVLRSDLQRIQDPDRIAVALPFAGKYYTPPARNYFRMGAALLWAGYPEEAVIYLDEVVRRTPDSFLAQLSLGQIHLGAGRVEAAREHLERALALNPESSSAWNDLGGVEMRQGNYPAALTDLQKALAIKPDESSALINCGLVQVRLGNPEAAEKMFRRALELDATDAEAAEQLGSLLANQGHLEEARKYLQQAIAAKRDDDFAINNLGVVYMQMRQFDDAIAAFQYGLQMAPANDILYLNLARAYVNAGDRSRAREALLRLLARKESEPARKFLEEIGGP
jgi:tetratricopeptide (TPR) repeat protein